VRKVLRVLKVRLEQQGHRAYKEHKVLQELRDHREYKGHKV